MSTSAEMDNRIALFNAKIAARGLAQKTLGAIFTTTDILTTNAIVASGLSFVNIEAYLDPPGDGNTQVNVNKLNSYLAAAKSRVRNAGKQIFLTGQAFDRNGLWSNMTTLEALQRPFYLNAYADNNVIGIQMFAYNRAGGTKQHPELQQAHREIGSVMGISPVMNIDIPTNNSNVAQPFTVAGWAIDRAVEPGFGTGVNTLHVWAFPTSGAAATFVGVTAYGGSRPDVGAAYGSQFSLSGFSVGVSGLAPGQYWIVAYPHSSVTGTFVKEQVILVNIVQ